MNATLHALPPTACEPVLVGAVGFVTSKKVTPALPSATAAVEPAKSTPYASAVERIVLTTGFFGSVRSTTATPPLVPAR